MVRLHSRHQHSHGTEHGQQSVADHLLTRSCRWCASVAHAPCESAVLDRAANAKASSPSTMAELRPLKPYLFNGTSWAQRSARVKLFMMRVSIAFEGLSLYRVIKHANEAFKICVACKSG